MTTAELKARLKAEIERRKKIYNEQLSEELKDEIVCSAYGEIASLIELCDNILSFLDTLEEPKQQINLEDEIVDYWKATEWSKSISLGKFKVIARYFYGLGQSSTLEEQSEVELEFRGEKVKVKRPFFRDKNGRGYSTTEQDEDVSWNALRAWCEKKGITVFDLYPLEEPVCEDLEEAAHSYSESDEPLYSPGHRFHWDSDSLFGKQIETTFKAGANWMKEQMMKEAVEGDVKEFRYIKEIDYSYADIEFHSIPKMEVGDKVKLIIVKED